jgi:predicted nucleic acid-binding protein
MTGGIVLDASVALKLVIAEAGSPQARALFATTVGARLPVYGPPLLPVEALNALYQRTRRADPDAALSFEQAEQAEQALSHLLALGFDIAAPAELYSRTLTFARAHGLPRTYDALYVVLAQLLDAELWTDDQHLLNALSGRAPWVRRLGDFPLP